MSLQCLTVFQKFQVVERLVDLFQKGLLAMSTSI